MLAGISRHYSAVRPDTPLNYVWDVDAFAVYCPHCQIHRLVFEGSPAPTCEKHGPMLPFNAGAGISCYARHWISMAEIQSVVRNRRLVAMDACRALLAAHGGKE